jgi:hypothetical protein
MARCSSCNKFVSFDEQDPEVNDLEVDESGHVTVSVRIVNACADCGQELTEFTFELEGDVELEKPEGDHEHELEVEEVSCERTQRQDGKAGTPSRYRRNFYGAELVAQVTCSCGFEHEVTLQDDVQGSGMDEC